MYESRDPRLMLGVIVDLFKIYLSSFFMCFSIFHVCMSTMITPGSYIGQEGISAPELEL